MKPTNIRHDRPGMEHWFRDQWSTASSPEDEYSLRLYEKGLLKAAFRKISQDLPLTDVERDNLFQDHRSI